MWNIYGDGPLEWSEDADAALYARVDGPLAWQQHALCAQTDPEAFFPDKGGSTREAKAVCQACQVREDCLEYALANDERFGIWGGMSERERRRLRRMAGRVPLLAPSVPSLSRRGMRRSPSPFYGPSRINRWPRIR